MNNEKCIICGTGKAIHNAAPVANGYCCDECNNKFIITIRIAKILESRRAKQEK